jgi:hypothetical protein
MEFCRKPNHMVKITQVVIEAANMLNTLKNISYNQINTRRYITFKTCGHINLITQSIDLKELFQTMAILKNINIKITNQDKVAFIYT